MPANTEDKNALYQAVTEYQWNETQDNQKLANIEQMLDAHPDLLNARYDAKSGVVLADDQPGDSILHVAARLSGKFVVKIHPTDEEQNDANQYINKVNESRYPILDLLFDRSGAETSPENAAGNTPFYLAAIVKDLEATQIMIEKGCDINATNNKGQTVLHALASKPGSEGMIEFLRDEGIKTTIKDDNGKEAIDYAANRSVQLSCTLPEADRIRILRVESESKSPNPRPIATGVHQLDSRAKTVGMVPDGY